MAKVWSYIGIFGQPSDIELTNPFVNDENEAYSVLEVNYPAAGQSVGTTGSVTGPSETFYFEVIDEGGSTIYAYFTTAGGTPASYETQSSSSGSLSVTSPGTPTRAGYTFTGWSPSLPRTITETTTFTAQWSANSFIITLDGNGGTPALNSQISVTYATSIETFGMNMIPTRENYNFEGYYTATSGGILRISPTAYVSLSSTTYTSAATLYAQWTPSSSIGIYIAESPNYSVSTTINNNSIVLATTNPKIVIGMPLVYVSGSNVWQSGTEIIGITYGVSNTTVTLSKHATGSGTSVIKFSEKRIDIDTAPEADNTTDRIYSRGLRGDRVYTFSSSSGWSGGLSLTLVQGRLYKIIIPAGSTSSVGDFGTIIDSDNNIVRSNGNQPISFQDDVSILPVISNRMVDSFTRISAENSSSYADLRESELPIFVAGSTSESYRLKLIDPNSITAGRVASYVIESGSSINFSTAFNAIKRSSSSSNAQCYITMTGGGGGGAGGRDGSYAGPGGGGGAGWLMFRTYFPGIWTSGSAGNGGLGRSVDSSLAGGNGTSSLIAGGGNIMSAGGGQGATWSGTSGIGGTGGVNSLTGTTLSLYRTTIHDIDGSNGGNSNAVGKGFNGSTVQTGVAVTATTLSHFGNLYLNSSNSFFYNMYTTSLTYVNNGPLTARNGGATGGSLGHGGGGGASAYANGGRGATTTIDSVAGSYGSGGGGGRSAFVSGERRAGSNGGSGVVIFYS